MFKPVLATILLCLTTGCYSAEQGQAREAIIQSEPALMLLDAVAEDAPDALDLEAQPSIFSGDLEHDLPLICAKRFLDNYDRVAIGLEPNSPIIPNYALQFSLDELVGEYLEQSCDIFDMGVLFTQTINKPEEVPPSRWDKPENGILT